MRKGIMLSVACYTFWGLFPLFWKLLTQLDSFYTLAMRIIWSMLFCGIILLARGRFSEVKKALRNKKERGLLICAGLLITINWGSYIWGVGAGRLMETSLAYFINPLVTVLLGAAVYRERLNALQWLAIAIAFAGVLVPVIETGTVPVLALLIAFSFGTYGIIKKDVKADGETAMFIETMVMFLPAAVFAGWMESRGTGAIGIIHGWQYLLLPLTGVVTSIPLILFAAGIKRTPCSLAGILMYINPILQFLLGVFLYGETFSNVQAVMFVCVWIAIVLFLIGQQRALKKGTAEVVPITQDSQKDCA